MIKRQFYTLEHRNGNDSASSSSSASSSDLSDAAVSDDDEVGTHQQDDDALSPAARRETTESSVDEELATNVGDAIPAWRRKCTSEDITDDKNEKGKREALKSVKRKQKTPLLKVDAELSNQWADAVEDANNERLEVLVDECIVKCKGVFKCRLCPKVICLAEHTMHAHLSSKKHARSSKQFAEGRLKVMLNSDGEEEEEGETHAERYARTIAFAQEHITKRKKNSGRQRQRKRAKRKASITSIGDKELLTTNTVHVSANGKKKVKQSAASRIIKRVTR